MINQLRMMRARKAIKIIEKYSEECTQCGICLNGCTLLNGLELTPGEIARAIFQDQVSDEIVAAIQRCDMCGRCSQDCLLSLNPAQLIKSAREFMVQNGRISPRDYDLMLVDRDWNLFTVYRDTYSIHYDDLLADEGDVLFFPGCTLACYAPELTRAAYNWLRTFGLQVGFTDMCCGKPLESIGFGEQAYHYLRRLRSQLVSVGVSQVIAACPSCEYHLKEQLTGMNVRSIYSCMLEAGVRLSGNAALAIHDSCPDRYTGENGAQIRQLLSGYPQAEMASNRKNSICCGSGGIVSMVDPNLCTQRAQRRIAEFSETNAETCVTSCMACSYWLGRLSQPGQVRHCLEYVFDVRIDYAGIERNARAMWEGSKGEMNLVRLAQSHILRADQD